MRFCFLIKAQESNKSHERPEPYTKMGGLGQNPTKPKQQKIDN